MSEKFIERVLAWLERMGPLFIEAAIILLIGKLLAKIVMKIMAKGLESKHIDNTAHTFMMSIVKTLIYVFSFIIALSALNVPMSSIVAAVGAAGLTLGLALQPSLTNVAGGFMILFSKPFQCGDYVSINSHEGFVTSISILYTKLKTWENKIIFIPNGTVSSTTITNFTGDEKRCLELTFSISYSSDFDKACDIIRRVIAVSGLAVDSPAKPFIVMSEHGDSAIKILTRTWVNKENYWDLRYYMFEQVKKEFDKNGIVIPFNQVDVTIKNT